MSSSQREEHLSRESVQSITLSDSRVVQLRSSALGDGPAVHAYICALGLSTDNILTHAEDLPSLKVVEDRIVNIAKGEFYSLVAVDTESGDVIGNASFTFKARKKLSHIADLGIGVLPDWQHVGLGSLLLNKAIDDMRMRPGIERIELTVLLKNVHARQMYEKTGFIQEGIKRRSIKQPNGCYEDEIIMGLWLSNDE